MRIFNSLFNRRPSIPPGKYFISHSYKDEDRREKMIKQLPFGVEPFIFAPIQVEAHQFVSDKLIEGILGCDGVICMRGGYSQKSFWVAFEKDYALRAGKPVYNYSPTWGSFSSDTTKPLKLSIYTVNSPQDQPLVDNISEFMSK